MVGVDKKWRLCGQEPESIHHLLLSCQSLAGMLYLDRHNNVTQYIHWCICQDFKMDVDLRWY
jgi:hypothetical protein